MAEGLESAYLGEGRHGHVPVKYLRTYDPTEEATKILTAATALDLADDAAILAFVNAWGLLGVAEPDAPHQLWDSVTRTKGTLDQIKGLAEWLRAMKTERWDDPALSVLSDRQLRMADDTQGGNRAAAYWAAFAGTLNECLSVITITPQLIAEGAGLRQVFRPRRIADLLYFALWQIADKHDSVLQVCRACRGLYPVSRTNEKKTYCSPKCKNRATVQQWRSRQTRKEA